jgi:hypothetical protein
MKPSVHYVLFVDLLTSWVEGPYRWKSTAQDNIKRIIAMTPNPPTHAKLRLEECEGRKRIETVEVWENRDGQWVQTT